MSSRHSDSGLPDSGSELCCCRLFSDSPKNPTHLLLYLVTFGLVNSCYTLRSCTTRKTLKEKVKTFSLLVLRGKQNLQIVTFLKVIWQWQLKKPEFRKINYLNCRIGSVFLHSLFIVGEKKRETKAFCFLINHLIFSPKYQSNICCL